MANNNEQSPIIVLSDDDKQQLPVIPTILPIGPLSDYETDSDDEAEQRMEAIQVEVNKFYKVLETRGGVALTTSAILFAVDLVEQSC